jgi:hypothetical protein
MIEKASLTLFKYIYYLKTQILNFTGELIIQDINDDDKNKVIRALETLIKQRLIIPQ